MRKTLPRRTIYAATIVAILALVSGYALASLAIGTFSSTPGQNAVSGNQISIPGVTFPAEQVILAGTSPTTTGACSSSDNSLNAPASYDSLLTSGAAALCLNSGGTTGSPAAYGAGDFIQVVEVEFSAAGGVTASTYFGIEVYLGGAATGTPHVGLPTDPVSAYVTTPSSGSGWTGSASITEWLTFDMTSSATTSLTTINVIVTDCGTTVCTF